MKKVLIPFLFICVAMLSCEKENLGLKSNEAPKKSLDKVSTLKEEFSSALAKALEKNIDLRNLLRDEALKKFDKDYDVLYAEIKNKKIGNKTLNEVIIDNLVNKESIHDIEKELPTLTIFIPTLPGNSFSAEKWNTNEEVPAVALNINVTYDVEIITYDGVKKYLGYKYVPGFPVVVIKENERVVKTQENAGDNIFETENGNFKFLSDEFNGTTSIANRTNVPDYQLDPKLITAYTTYQNVDGWQRDYIYYNITPTTPNGAFTYNFSEFIKSFKMNDVNLNYSDQTGDPVLSNLYSNFQTNPDLPRAPWTNGFFEFKVNVLINASNGVGSSIEKYFTASPQQLFDTYYDLVYSFNFFGNFRNIWQLRSITPKELPLNIPLFNWDLNQYASSIKITIEEVDLTEEITTTDSRSVKFATNFGIDVTGLKKIGLKFGVSLELTQTSSVTYKVTKSSDQLGDVIVNFADNVIVSQNGTNYNTREYSSGRYIISVEPGRVQ